MIYFVWSKISLYIDETFLCYLNKSYSITFVNYAWLLKKILTEKILKIATSLKVRGIKSSKHKSDEFVLMSLYFPDTDLRNRLICTYINQEFHLVKGLKANLLRDNNILVTKRVIIDLANKTTMISSYQVMIYIIIRPRSYLI